MGAPGCPDFAFWTASAYSIRIVLTQSASSSVPLITPGRGSVITFLLHFVGDLSYLWMRAEPHLAKDLTCANVAMVVSPGKVVISAPWAQPSLTASSGDSPAIRP